MGHDLLIGRPIVEPIEDGDTNRLRPTVEPITTPVGETPIHEDDYEVETTKGSGERWPSFRCWEQVLDAYPAFDELWFTIREYATAHNEPPYIPVAAYIDQLDAVEDEALSELAATEDEIDRFAEQRTAGAQRVLWFVRWSRYAHEELGEMAAFQSGEPLAFSHARR